LPPLRRGIAAAVLVALLAYGAGSVATAAKLQRYWPGGLARTWEANLERGLAKAGRAQPASILAESVPPGYIVGAAFPPFDQLSLVAPLYGRPLRVDGPLTGRLLTVDATGNVRPARVRAVYSDPLDRCLPGGAPAPPLLRRLPGSLSAAAGPYYLLASYSTQRPATLALGVESRIGVATHADPTVSLTPAAHQSIAWLGTAAPRWLKLTFPASTGLCLNSLRVVTLGS
jgi:hypothetical protein